MVKSAARDRQGGWASPFARSSRQPCARASCAHGWGGVPVTTAQADALTSRWEGTLPGVSLQGHLSQEPPPHFAPCYRPGWCCMPPVDSRCLVPSGFARDQERGFLCSIRWGWPVGVGAAPDAVAVRAGEPADVPGSVPFLCDHCCHCDHGLVWPPDRCWRPGPWGTAGSPGHLGPRSELQLIASHAEGAPALLVVLEAGGPLGASLPASHVLLSSLESERGQFCCISPQ